ncbi:MAG: transporter substrate-binding domain-containing protein [Motiliproteus sp.]
MRLLTGCLLCLLATVCRGEAGLADDERPVITLAADIWCPYNCDPQSDRPGYVVEMAQQIFSRAGYRVDYRVMPWARALQSVDRGTITGAIGASPYELSSGVFPEQEIGQFRGHFIIPRTVTWRYQGDDSLDGMHIGVVNGYDYGSFNRFIERNRDSDWLEVLSGDNAMNRGLAMVARQRLDAYVEDRNVASYTIEQMQLQNQLMIGDSVGTPVKLYIAFSDKLPKSQQYRQILNDGIVAMRASGELAQILGRYGIKDWNP